VGGKGDRGTEGVNGERKVKRGREGHGQEGVLKASRQILDWLFVVALNLSVYVLNILV